MAAIYTSPLLLLLATTILLTSWVASKAHTSHSTNTKAFLISHLLKGSNRVVRPVVHYDHPVVVALDIQLIKIMEVHEEENHVAIKYSFTVTWINELLTWNHTLWGGVKSVQVPHVCFCNQ
jgi:hypothetical protein